MANIDSEAYLSKVISGVDPKDTTQFYNNNPDTYESAMADVQYFGPKKLMEFFDRINLPKEAKILDVCAGTGGIGRELAKLGYADLHAIDGAEGMLAKAKEENNYKSYTHLLFTPESKLPYADNEFDCLLAAGIFAPGHLPICAMHEFARVVKPGGVIAWICCDPKCYETKDKQYENGGFQKLVDEIAAKGQWKQREGFPIPVPYINYSDGFVMAFDVL